MRKAKPVNSTLFTVTFWVKHDIIEALRAEAVKRDLDVSKIMRALVRKFLAGEIDISR